MASSKNPESVNVADVQIYVNHVMKEVGPHLRLERKWGHEWYAGTDLVCGVFAFKQHVDIEFWRGTMLSDPSGLLVGTGTNLRHVKVHTLIEAQAPALRALLRAAVTLDEGEPKRPH